MRVLCFGNGKGRETEWNIEYDNVASIMRSDTYQCVWQQRPPPPPPRFFCLRLCVSLLRKTRLHFIPNTKSVFISLPPLSPDSCQLIGRARRDRPRAF